MSMWKKGKDDTSITITKNLHSQIISFVYIKYFFIALNSLKFKFQNDISLKNEFIS